MISILRRPLRAFPLLSLVVGYALLALAVAAAPVEFSFRPAPTDGNPFSRDIWARIETPDRSIELLPAFFTGDGIWSVRTRATTKGNYRWVDASEIINERSTTLPAEAVGNNRLKVRDADPLGPAIAIDPRSGRHFIDGNGAPYVPLGGNLPWASGVAPGRYFPAALADFKTANLNWTRIWMCHWGRLNLDWSDPDQTDPDPQPALGELSLVVATRWDRIIDAAEANGVRLQMVLQHHGQYTTFNNSNWAENPWNAANEGGFLATPTDFFTDAHARQLTRDKYRYIAARWGYSSSILSWELFNEIMWTNARRGDAADNAAIAAWHNEMARHLRRYDVHHHLVTSSDDDLGHALWATMDYYQPHLYGSNMVLGVQALELNKTAYDRPAFYGEVGDDNMLGLSSNQRATGFVQPILAWSGLFGAATQPAQLWYTEILRENDRWSEMVSLGAFVRASGLNREVLPTTFYPRVVGGDTAPLRLEPGHYWHRGPNPDLTVPTDGTEPAELMDFRRVLTNSAAIPAHPFPNRATLHFDYPAAANAKLTVTHVANPGGSLRLTLDDKIIADQTWPAAAHDLEFPFRVGYGQHNLVIENPVGEEWIELGGLDLGLTAPALTAVARRNADRVVLWVRHRTNLLSPLTDAELTPTSGTVQLNDLPPGEWLVTWWDIAAGRTASTQTLTHRGGPLSLPTPTILRHAAAWLQRLE